MRRDDIYAERKSPDHMGTPSPEKRVDQVLREEPGLAALIGGGGWGPTLAAVDDNLSSSIVGVATNTTNLQSSGQARIPIPHPLRLWPIAHHHPPSRSADFPIATLMSGQAQLLARGHEMRGRRPPL